MNVSISICPTSLEFADGGTYDETALLAAIREFVTAKHPGATISCLQIGHRQGDAWATVDGDREAGEALLTEFFDRHGSDEGLFEPAVAYEVRMADSVENTGLDGQRFASREEAQQAADTVNADRPQARAEVVEVVGEPTITFAAWNEAGW